MKHTALRDFRDFQFLLNQRWRCSVVKLIKCRSFLNLLAKTGFSIVLNAKYFEFLGLGSYQAIIFPNGVKYQAT